MVVRGDQQIVVTIPSRDDPRRILELVGETYQLTLRLVVDDGEVFDYHGRRLALAPPAFSGDMLDEGAIRVETAAQGSLDVREMAPKVAFGFRPVVALLLFTERLRSFAVFIFVGLFASVVTIFITRRLLERTYGRLPDFGPDLLAGLRRWQPRALGS